MFWKGNRFGDAEGDAGDLLLILQCMICGRRSFRWDVILELKCDGWTDP